MSTNDGGIIRVIKDSHYFVASNEAFNDPKLSWGAKGIMGYLLSKPDGWIVRNHDLYNHCKDGRWKVDGYLRQLKENFYLRRYQYNDENGRLHWVTEVYESKALNPDYEYKLTERSKTNFRSPNVCLPTVGKPGDIVNTEKTSTDLNKLPENGFNEQADLEKINLAIRLDLGGSGNDVRRARKLYFELRHTHNLIEIAKLAMD